MPRETGFGIQYDADEIEENERVYNKSRTRFACAWVGRVREDRFDRDVTFEIGLYDVETKACLKTFVRTHSTNRATGESDGPEVSGCHFDPKDDTVLIVDFADGTSEPAT